MNWIHQHLLMLAAPAAITAILAAAMTLPAILEARAIRFLDWFFTHGDAADDEWLSSCIKWADVKYGPGTGAVKAKAVVDYILSDIPPPYRMFITTAVEIKAVALFQQAFDRLEDAALKEAAEHVPPPAAGTAPAGYVAPAAKVPPPLQ